MITIPNLKVGVFHQLQSSQEAAAQKILRMCNFVEEDVIAKIYILAYEGTVDMNWTEKALEGLDQRKISYLDYRNITQL